jgi:type I restriction enzyme R subunit
MSRDICVHLYNAIIALRPEWHDEDPERGVIKIVMTGSASDKPLLRPHIYSKQIKKRLEKRFKDPDDPLRLVIVRDMWLTGFDAPCVHTMYVDKPNIGILDDAFLNDVRNLPERNLAVELLERLLEGEIRTRFATNVVQQTKFSELLANVILRYQNRAIETAQVIEELIAMAKKFKEAIGRGEELGLNADELAFYDALANNEEAVREMGDEILKKIAHELAESLRQNISVDWSVRDNVRAKLRLMVKRILRKYKYPPDRQDAAVQLVLDQAETLSAEWG